MTEPKGTATLESVVTSLQDLSSEHERKCMKLINSLETPEDQIGAATSLVFDHIQRATLIVLLLKPTISMVVEVVHRAIASALHNYNAAFPNAHQVDGQE